MDVDPETLPAQAVMPNAAVSRNNPKYTLKRVRLEANFLLPKMSGDSKSGIRKDGVAAPGRVSLKTAVI